MVVNTLLLALGANQAGAWGPPDQTLVRARHELACAGVRSSLHPIFTTLCRWGLAGNRPTAMPCSCPPHPWALRHCCGS